MKKISTAHILLLLIFVLQFALSFFLAFADISLPTVARTLVGQGTILLPFAVYCIVKRENPLKLIRVKKIGFKTVILSAVVAFCSYPVAIFLNFVSMLFVDNAMTDVMNDMMSMGLLTTLTLVAVLPAIVEETVFRGMLYNTYSKRKPLMGIILSALLFGLMHGNLNQMPYTLFLGLVMAFLMEAADSILAPMIMHFTLNGTSTLLSWFASGSEESASGATNIREVLMESYRESYAQQGLEIAEAELQSMVSVGIVIMLIMYAVIAIIAGSIVFVIIYCLFRSRGVTLKDVFKADRSETAYVETKSGKLRKNRMIDIYVIAFIIISAGLCVLDLFV